MTFFNEPMPMIGPPGMEMISMFGNTSNELTGLHLAAT
jgi:hypothetical protein